MLLFCFSPLTVWVLTVKKWKLRRCDDDSCKWSFFSLQACHNLVVQVPVASWLCSNFKSIFFFCVWVIKDKRTRDANASHQPHCFYESEKMYVLKLPAKIIWWRKILWLACRLFSGIGFRQIRIFVALEFEEIFFWSRAHWSERFLSWRLFHLVGFVQERVRKCTVHIMFHCLMWTVTRLWVAL